MNQDKMISDCLKKCGKDIYNALRSMYPEHGDIINYHYKKDTPFNEWFGILFKMEEWVLKGPIKIPMSKIEVSESKYKETHEAFKTNEKYSLMLENVDFSKLSYITVVKPEDKYLIVDGYHRFYMHDQLDLVSIEAFEWVKEKNTHPMAKEIVNLIIKNLGK